MLEIMRIFVSGLVATSFMTAFSYIAANVRNKEFREPELLNQLLSKSSLFRLKLSKKSIAGWILHYLIGWMFVIVFEIIWELELVPFSILWGGILGLVAGILGVIGWKIFFAISDDPPKTDWNEYYVQLIIAHIIFGFGAALVYAVW